MCKLKDARVSEKLEIDKYNSFYESIESMVISKQSMVIFCIYKPLESFSSQR